MADYVAHGTFGSRLQFLNSWEPEHRLLLGYTFAGALAVSAVSALRKLIDNTMVVIDSNGIEVRHAYWTERALWRDFEEIKVSKLLGRHVSLKFLPGRDAQGRRLSRKVQMPSPLFKVDTKAVLFEVLLRTAVEAKVSRAAPPLPPVRGFQPAPMAATARPVFGKRR